MVASLKCTEPMKLLFQGADTPQILLKALQRVGDKLTNDCPHFAEVRDSVYVIVDTDKDKLQTTPLELSGLNEGFAHIESNYFLRENDQNAFVHLLIVHYHKCVLGGLSEDELAGVILHELGHIINDSINEPVPSFLESLKANKPFDFNDIEKIEYQDDLIRECYADYFARKHGFGKEVINSLVKYNAMTSIPSKKIVIERIAILSTPIAEEMQGRVKTLKSM